MHKFVRVASTALVACLFVAASAAAGGPAQKATGSFTYYDGNYYFQFNAHEPLGDRPAKGEAFNLHIPTGSYYKADVVCARVAGNNAWFLLDVYETNAGWGPYVYIKVQDNGTPGSAGDFIWGAFMTNTNVCSDLSSGSAAGPWSVFTGNLVVHHN